MEYTKIGTRKWRYNCTECGEEATAGAKNAKYCQPCREVIRAEYYQVDTFYVLERDAFKCWYCGRTPREGAILVVDHIIPRKLGGTNALSNLITACSKCNTSKLDKLLKGPSLAYVQEVALERCKLNNMDPVTLVRLPLP